MKAFEDPERTIDQSRLFTTQRQMLFALQRKPIYTGTVPTHVVAKRRARNKVARLSRRINRGTR